MRSFILFTYVLIASCNFTPARAELPSLQVLSGNTSHAYALADLLARPDAALVTIPADADYSRSMTYRAVPLLSLLQGLPRGRYDILEARAADGFVAQIPLTLIDRAQSGGAIPWIAIEPPDQRWPNLPGKDASAGPFYLIWQYPERSGVIGEQWPYQLASLTLAELPAHRWPQLALGPEAGSQAQRGQAVFATACLPCHKLNGGGAAEVGPDLGQPMNATAYLTETGLIP